MRVVATVAAVRAELEEAGRPLGLVPTMGGLHAGHVALLRAARAQCATSVASLFVNPTQFGPGEDYASYPRNRPGDLAIMEQEGVDLVYAPTVDEMYPEGFDTTVSVGRLAQRLEGASRPGHLGGVTTVVCKLISTVRPQKAYFGCKDAQQLLVVGRMAEDLCLGAEIVAVPTVREPDGLALSSRNFNLGEAERRASLGLYEALCAAKSIRAGGGQDAGQIREAMRRAMHERSVTVDYVSVADPTTLEELETIDGPALALVAGFVGKTRLIDNESI